MRALKNMSVRVKIMIPLLTLAVIIFGMGITSYIGMNNIMDASTSISGNYARCLDMVGDFNADFQEISRIAYNHIVADDEAAYKALDNEVEKFMPVSNRHRNSLSSYWMRVRMRRSCMRSLQRLLGSIRKPFRN